MNGQTNEKIAHDLKVKLDHLTFIYCVSYEHVYHHYTKDSAYIYHLKANLTNFYNAKHS
jgi:uncharacterized protein YlaN (UPF0358 family)